MLSIIGTWALGTLTGTAVLAVVVGSGIWILEHFSMAVERFAEIIGTVFWPTLALSVFVGMSYGFYRLGDLILRFIA